tara:strand:- start:817 stop:1317 length:501 start_codon:yes stop_codon:yes gene_type:complete
VQFEQALRNILQDRVCDFRGIEALYRGFDFFGFLFALVGRRELLFNQAIDVVVTGLQVGAHVAGKANRLDFALNLLMLKCLVFLANPSDEHRTGQAQHGKDRQPNIKPPENGQDFHVGLSCCRAGWFRIRPEGDRRIQLCDKAIVRREGQPVFELTRRGGESYRSG